MFQKKWSFGLGTIFSLIVIYFIYLYSKDKGLALLALISKWYLIVVGGFIALSVGIVLLVILLMLLIFLIAMLKLHVTGKKPSKKFSWANFKKGNKNHKEKNYVDVEYKIKE